MNHEQAFDIVYKESQKRLIRPAQLLSDWLAKRDKVTNECNQYSKEVNAACKIVTNNK